MNADTLIALGIVAAALAYLVGRAVSKSRARKAEGPDCTKCGH